jgi:polyphenol oxidase
MSHRAIVPLGARLTARGHDWIVPWWPVAAQVQGFVTTRNGGVSAGPYATLNLGTGGDDDAAVAENRRRVEAFLPSAPVWLDQVHGTTVAVVTGEARSKAPVADAAVTREANVVLAVRAADCLPVLLAARDGDVIGIAHAGWRGLAHGVVENTVDAMGIPSSEIVAWLGPAIEPDAFEVGDDVFVAFTENDGTAAASFRAARPGKWHADLYALARRRLERTGVRDVFGGGYCTYSDDARFFSYRRARETGRMAAFLWIGSAWDTPRNPS